MSSAISSISRSSHPRFASDSLHTAGLERRWDVLSISAKKQLHDCEELRAFLSRTAQFLEQSSEGACHGEDIAHLLMGRTAHPPAVFDHLFGASPRIPTEIATILSDLLRTHRYGFFGKTEAPEKTREKLLKLCELLNPPPSAQKADPTPSVPPEKKLARDVATRSITDWQQACGRASLLNPVVPGPQVPRQTWAQAPETGFCFQWRGAELKMNLRVPEKHQLLVQKDIQAYFNLFNQHIGDGTKKLLEDDPQAVQKARDSLEVLCDGPSHLKDALAYQRQLVNIAMESWSPWDAEILGWTNSGSTENKDELSPGGDLSICMQTPVVHESKVVGTPWIIGVSAPALDTPKQPAWGNYVTPDGQLKADEYRTAYQALTGHIKNAAKMHPGSRVVLSSVGTGAFLKGLGEAARAEASEIAKAELRSLAQSLSDDGHGVFFTGGKESCKEIFGDNAKSKYLGFFPGNWVQDNDLIVNAWDPHSLLGNGNARDPSLDGFIGRSTVIHQAHLLASLEYKYKIKEELEYGAYGKEVRNLHDLDHRDLKRSDG